MEVRLLIAYGLIAVLTLAGMVTASILLPRRAAERRRRRGIKDDARGNGARLPAR